MRGPRFAADPVDAEFLDSAPLRRVGTFEIGKPAADVWAELIEDNPLHWCRILKGIEWTSPRPFGEGTTRTARALAGILVIDEVFFRWEEGRRKTFRAIEFNLPLFKSLAEDYLVEPMGDAACRFTWTIAAQSRPGSGPADPVYRRLLDSLFTDTRRHFAS